ncbi:hypothetical protein ANN_19112 [Periplaneta americana]|uniref:Uncharacterized protein n=1 Tax=Periplaneta americana TaxID=6978 RepID=A0ABQ8S8Y7_PERAM|nr:hypothetical protein ANN_19112 [Periplaneta americana]
MDRSNPKETYPAPKVGTGPKTDGLKPAIKLKWMFIGRLDDSTTENDIIEYMKDKGIMAVKACHEIRNRNARRRSGQDRHRRFLAGRYHFSPLSVFITEERKTLEH